MASGVRPMSPVETFEVTEDVFETSAVKNVMTKLFWEVVYFLLLPLEGIRYLAVKFAILPGTFVFSKKRADHQRATSEECLNGKGVGVRRVSVITADRVKLDTYEVVPTRAQEEAPEEQKWIVFFNGNCASTEGMLVDLAQIAVDTGARVFSGNYRGVGHSTGFPWRSQDLVLDGEAMVQRLLAKGVKPEHILLHGWSMGGGVAAAVAAKHPGMHLCSDRSFATFDREVQELGQQILGGKVLAKIAASIVKFIDWTFDSVGNYDKVTGEKFVMHHPCDGVIPHKASLYYGLKQAHRSEGEGRKPERIRLQASWETRADGWRSQRKGISDRMLMKTKEKNKAGQGHHCAGLVILKQNYLDGYQAYVERVRNILNPQSNGSPLSDK